MALVTKATLTANGDTTISLNNTRGSLTRYSVYLGYTSGTGTITAFLQADGANDIPLLDAAGVAVSLTANGMFNFEAYSASGSDTVKLIITLAGSSTPNIELRVCDNK